MNIIIIEDEVKTAKALAQLLITLAPDAKIIASIQSVEGAVKFLTANKAYGLIFMDVQLADGLCFEIFKEVRVLSPVIFCTAYDEYALEAFKANGVDYILKPFSKESLTAALDKVSELKNFFQRQENPLSALETLASKLGANGKKSFLVFKNNKYLTIPTANIAFFYIRNATTTLVTFDQQEYPVALSLDEVYNLLTLNEFFRVNRQYLISFAAVKEVEHYFARKLLVKLVIETPEKLLIGKDKTTSFLNWLADR